MFHHPPPSCHSLHRLSERIGDFLLTTRRVGPLCLVLLVLALAGTGHGAENAPGNLVPQGDFTVGKDGLPRGWHVEGWMRKHVSMRGENDEQYLRITSDHKRNDKTLHIREVPLPAGTTHVAASYLGRLGNLDRGSEGYQTAAVEINYLQEGTSIGQFRIHLHDNTPEWTFQQVTHEIPEGADALGIRVGFWRSSGTFDVYRLQITAVNIPRHEIPGPPAGHEAALTPAPKGTANGSFPLAGDFAQAASVEETGWSEFPGGLGEQRAPVHSLVDTPDGRVLDIAIPSQAFLKLTRDVPVREGAVYRVTLDARCVGQVEQVHVNRFLHHRKRLRWPLAQQWSPYVVQAKADKSGKLQFEVELSGVGSFQVREYKIEELDDFDLPAVVAPHRGELLSNGDFALGHLDWSLRYTKRDESPLSPTSERQNVQEALRVGTAAGLNLPTERFGMLFSGTPLTLYYGRDYAITIRGQFAPGDLDVFLVRPGQFTHDNERFAPNFKDGVATLSYRPRPEAQMISEPTQAFALFLRHNGNATAVLESVSVREGAAKTSITPARVGVELVDDAGQHDGIRFVGDIVIARVRTAGLQADSRVEVVVTDEVGDIVRRLSLDRQSGDPGRDGIDVPIAGLRQGWYRVSAEADDGQLVVVSDDVAVIPRSLPGRGSNGFLGTHLRDYNHAAQAQSLADIGFARVRGYYAFEWFRAQPSPDSKIQLQVEQLEHLKRIGLEPMLVLWGTPEWASSMPKGTPGWLSYAKHPPRDMADWQKYVAAAVEACRDQVTYYEIWNEPNDHFLKKAPGDPRSLEDIYAELVRTAAPIIKQRDPDGKVVIGSTAGSPWFIVQTLKKHPDLLGLADAISWHAYESMYLANQGALGFSHRNLRQSWLQDYLREVGRPDMPIFDTESGLHRTVDGPEGRHDAMLTAKGLVARQAAGFSQFYLFHAASRLYPGQIDINNVFGFGGRPLVSVSAFAAWDRLLGNSRFMENLGDDKNGRHIYRFQCADGQQVIAAWSSNPAAHGPFDHEALLETVAVDYLGRLLNTPPSRTLHLGDDLHYYITPAQADLFQLRPPSATHSVTVP